MINSNDLDREIGKMQSDIEYLKNDTHELKNSMESVRKDLEDIKKILHQVGGGWKALVIVGAFCSALSAAIVKFGSIIKINF